MELAAHDSYFEDMAIKFADHSLWIARAMNQLGPDGMWDEEDGFYYDVLRMPDGSASRLKVRSLVGLLPMCATTIVDPSQFTRLISDAAIGSTIRIEILSDGKRSTLRIPVEAQQERRVRR